ncbi:hypothetical protein VM1G_02740 [Cytospora mali]|uniref:Uncharacterized protein n=1 Tax=Cytospora mali TaxID=578113 RepID=A0A194VUL6_CYTMA|nr:hypothetical protein VM1G_02740 [Valsa mali]
MSGEPPRKKIKLKTNFKKSNLKNAIRAARDDFDPPFPEPNDESDDSSNSSSNTDRGEDQEYDSDPDPEGDLEIAPGTTANTRLNTGYTSPYAQKVAQAILVDQRGRCDLRIIALQGQQVPTITTAQEQEFRQSSDEDATATEESFAYQGRIFPRGCVELRCSCATTSFYSDSDNNNIDIDIDIEKRLISAGRRILYTYYRDYKYEQRHNRIGEE